MSWRLVAAGCTAAALLALVVVLVVGRGSGTPRDPDEPPAPNPAPEVAATHKGKEPATLDTPPVSHELSPVGVWDPVLVGPAKALSPLTFTADGKVTAEFGYKGNWVLTGRKLVLFGSGPKTGGAQKAKGELDEGGKVLRLWNPKGGGVADVFHRR